MKGVTFKITTYKLYYIEFFISILYTSLTYVKIFGKFFQLIYIKKVLVIILQLQIITTCIIVVLFIYISFQLLQTILIVFDFYKIEIKLILNKKIIKMLVKVGNQQIETTKDVILKLDTPPTLEKFVS